MEKFLFEESGLFPHDIAELLKYQAFLMPNWKWIILVGGFVLGFFVRPVVQYVLKKIKENNRLVKRYPKSFWAYLLAYEIERPLAWMLISAFWFSLGNLAELPKGAHENYDHVVRTFLAINFVRLIYYIVDAMGAVMADYAAKTESTVDDQLAPFATKALKVLVIVMGVLIVMQSFGLNVMSLLAGLGLGGLALALAAQDTAANLFGSITILLDQPFKIGDWVKVKDMEGTVEEIGFRSTRVRTFYNSVITIPNAMMAKETIDNMGIRPYRRIRQNIGIAYETPPAVIEEFCARVRYIICQHPEVVQETASVAFNNFGDSALNILVNFHIRAYTGDEESRMQQGVFLEILRTGAEMNVEFAYPTRTVYHREAPLLEEPEPLPRS